MYLTTNGHIDEGLESHNLMVRLCWKFVSEFTEQGIPERAQKWCPVVKSGRMRPYFLIYGRFLPEKQRFYQSLVLRRERYMSRGPPIFFWEDTTCIVLKLHGLRHGAGTPPSHSKWPIFLLTSKNIKKQTIFRCFLPKIAYFVDFQGPLIWLTGLRIF